MRIASGKRALTNATFLVGDENLTGKPLKIGFPVLQHVQRDKRTLLENNRTVLDRADFLNTGNQTTLARGGFVIHMMIAHLICILSDEGKTNVETTRSSDRPHVNFYTSQPKKDLIPDPLLLVSIDSDQRTNICKSLDGMQKTAIKNGFLTEHQERMFEIVDRHIDLFRTAFSIRPPAQIGPLTIELTLSAASVKTRLRNYSRDKWSPLPKFVGELVSKDMANENSTSPWACAPSLVPKPGPEVQNCSTADLFTFSRSACLLLNTIS